MSTYVVKYRISHDGRSRTFYKSIKASGQREGWKKAMELIDEKCDQFGGVPELLSMEQEKSQDMQ